VSGGPARAFKRLQVQVEWSENRISTRRISLTSVVYPGGIGPAGSTNQPPTVSFVQSPTSCVQAGTTTVNFDATGSDPEGGALSYTWSFGDSTQAFTEDASKTYSLGGTYNVSVEAKDAQGATGAASGTVTVSSGTNALPTINPAVSPSSGTAPLAVVANANAVDPEGDPLTYRWEWGDGSPDATTASAGKTYQTPGTYTVKLTVTENGCRTVTWTGTVTAVPLQCAILSGSHFLNPTTNTTKNEILVRSDNEVPANRKDIRFVVYTNAACSGAKVQLPISGGVFTATLTDFAEANGVRTWTVDTSLNKVVFVRGDNQQATVYAPAASPTVTAYHSFNVRLTS
jgi:PKD repeat protein